MPLPMSSGRRWTAMEGLQLSHQHLQGSVECRAPRCTKGYQHRLVVQSSLYIKVLVPSDSLQSGRSPFFTFLISHILHIDPSPFSIISLSVAHGSYSEPNRSPSPPEGSLDPITALGDSSLRFRASIHSRLSLPRLLLPRDFLTH
jgi:hypothetical protein